MNDKMLDVDDLRNFIITEPDSVRRAEMLVAFEDAVGDRIATAIQAVRNQMWQAAEAAEGKDDNLRRLLVAECSGLVRAEYIALDGGAS